MDYFSEPPDKNLLKLLSQQYDLSSTPRMMGKGLSASGEIHKEEKQPL
jgi:hypothetical protein